MQTSPQIDFSLSHLTDSLMENLNSFLPKIPNAIATAVFGYLIIRLISWVMRWVLSFVRMPRGLRSIVLAIFDTLMMVFLIIVVLRALGLNDIALAITAGIAALGIALGNGSVTLVSDIISGVYLARDPNFRIGDIVIAGENKVKGEIVGLDVRRTRIMDEKGLIHSLPNSVVDRHEFILITKKRDRK